MTAVPCVTLHDGNPMPQLGFGTWQIPDADVAEPVSAALHAGYRLIDTAQGYENERGVGEGLRASGLPREEVFLTTKLANERQGYDAALYALDESLKKLRLSYVDLYLIHWPVPSKDLYLETWRALVKAREDGRAKSIGVSNFQPEHLARIVDETGQRPVLNQVERHPWFQQSALAAVQAPNDIVMQAWSPLGQGKLLDDPTLISIGRKHGKNSAQVVLRWQIQSGATAIPKSVNPERIRANSEIFGFSLDESDLAAIASLDTGRRIGPDPDVFG